MFHSTRVSILRQTQYCLRSSRNLPSPLHSTLAHYLSSLAILEQREGKLQNASLSAVTAAQKLGGSITGIVAGSGVKSVAEEASKVKGLDRIIMIENASYDKVGLHFTGHIKYPPLLRMSYRVFLKTTPLYLSKTLRKKDSHTF